MKSSASAPPGFARNEINIRGSPQLTSLLQLVSSLSRGLSGSPSENKICAPLFFYFRRAAEMGWFSVSGKSRLPSHACASGIGLDLPKSLEYLKRVSFCTGSVRSTWFGTAPARQDQGVLFVGETSRRSLPINGASAPSLRSSITSLNWSTDVL